MFGMSTLLNPLNPLNPARGINRDYRCATAHACLKQDHAARNLRLAASPLAHRPSDMKRLLAVLAASIPLMAWTVAWAADSSPDDQFFYDAAESGIAEVSDANLAKKRSDSHVIERYADGVLKDQTAANDKLQSLAASESVDLPGHPGLKQRARHTKLDLIDSKKFDAEYVEGQDKALRETIMLYEQEVASGKDARARSYAQQTLPMLKSRLEEIRKIAAQTGANVT